MDNNKKAVIELQNVKREFVVGDETVHALRGVSFKIYEGEFVTIMGKSGSGSSAALTHRAVASICSTASLCVPCRRANVRCCATERLGLSSKTITCCLRPQVWRMWSCR
jgi:ABC-type glutathione transport system ATPase component